MQDFLQIVSLLQSHYLRIFSLFVKLLVVKPYSCFSLVVLSFRHLLLDLVSSECWTCNKRDASGVTTREAIFCVELLPPDLGGAQVHASLIIMSEPREEMVQGLFSGFTHPRGYVDLTSEKSNSHSVQFTNVSVIL